jgi:hypothetical protein
VNLVDWWNRDLLVGLWMRVRLLVCLLKWRLLPRLFLMKDVDCLLKLCEPFSFSFNVQPLCFSLLGRCLPSSDDLLLLAKLLDLLLHFGQLPFRSSFILLLLCQE